MSLISEIFSEQGMLSQHISGYQPRESQLQMAEAVNKVLSEKQQLVVEAGTGTGKTLAYMVPAMLNQSKKVIVSTGTKALQEQLFIKDVPLLKKALKPAKQVALLKGRSNYLCLHRLDMHSRSGFAFEKSVLVDLVKVREWSSTTKSGDIGELATVQEGAAVLPFVTSTLDNCLGADCPDYQVCHVVKARRKAMDADIVVINHHLFFADMALKDTGFGELIPSADLVVFDEAHQLPDIASEYFGESVSTRQIQELCRDIESEYRDSLTDVADLHDLSEQLTEQSKEFRLCFDEQGRRAAWKTIADNDTIMDGLNGLCDKVEELYEVLKTCVSRNKEIDNCFERCVRIKFVLGKFKQLEMKGYGSWYETTAKHAILRFTPLHIADKFSALLERQESAWVFTSATLSVDQRFDHYTERMGIEKPVTLNLPSPFDYQNQAMLCIPRYMPEPNEREMLGSILDTATQIIAAAQGRCFLLFTSYRMLDLVAERLAKKSRHYNLLVQGSTSKRELLQQFVEKTKTVLLATSSFWEGVDVRGDDLIAVLIDKLPFAAPDDPLLQARIEDCRNNGGDPFKQIQLPQSVIAMKQGAGRLIRDVEDRGVLVICDNRVVTRAYGELFLSSLPPMKRTRDLKLALDYLKEIE